ncbi:MAG: hypothetical protein V3S98_01190, partial [Dehalococcoidia bacterium]
TVKRLGGRIKGAVAAGAKAKSFSRPAPEQAPRPRPTSVQVSRLNKLKKWRSSVGEELALDPSLLWPMRSLERLARDPGALDQEFESADVRRWQRKEYGAALKRVLS